ncbi:hypothetical protein LNL84_02345 [Vibrio sp. ZSDZ34]|uniref:Uncharacterized protein n=1 Tax=Vibrio gelatinilyticus TaxID=2893468 RepID=A0A9X1W8M5_9VIBR|nr:hypothetical protein [Vibrio gelatinilyticus]MCJ2375664.1 hypothetical protein [Vibrio gelatinilyticus]
MSYIKPNTPANSLLVAMMFMNGLDERLTLEDLADGRLLKKVRGGYKPHVQVKDFFFKGSDRRLILTRDGAEYIYNQYVNSQLVMRADWDGSFTSKSELKQKIADYKRVNLRGEHG